MSFSKLAALYLSAISLISGASPVVGSAAAVRDLVPSEARKEFPVHISGVVTWVNVRNGELFVQDATAGIFVFIRNSKTDRILRAGQTVDVMGVTAPGDFSSSITKASIHVTGEGEMPKSPSLSFDRYSLGRRTASGAALRE